MDTIEKLEKRENELLDLLGRSQIGSEDYQKTTELLRKIAELKDMELKTEHARLNNNARNDIDQQKVEVDMKRVAVESAKVKSGYASEFFDLAKLGLFGYITYHGEQVSYGIKELKAIVSRLASRRR
jgi:hypothetical protein